MRNWDVLGGKHSKKCSRGKSNVFGGAFAFQGSISLWDFTDTFGKHGQMWIVYGVILIKIALVTSVVS